VNKVGLTRGELGFFLQEQRLQDPLRAERHYKAATSAANIEGNVWQSTCSIAHHYFWGPTSRFEKDEYRGGGAILCSYSHRTIDGI
jgi:hypothetical protein